MPDIPLDAPDAIELAGLLQSLAGWMKSGRDYLAPSLARYPGIDVEGQGPEALAGDFNRFRFLLGATDGGDVFTRMSHEQATGAQRPEPAHARPPANRRSA